MSNILNSEDFGSKIYNRFPPKYREDDVDQNYALERYIQATSEGGFKYAIDDINGITALIDPDRVSSDVLPILFKQYGLDIFNGIPEDYLRYLLPRLGEAWSKKGSLSVLEFITSSLSGVKTSTRVSYDSDENPLVEVKLEMDYNIGDYFPEAEQFRRLLENFVPFYCDVVMLYSYLFYDNLNLLAKEKVIDNITDEKYESCTIGSSVGYSYFPTLNISALNKDFILNKGNHYEETDVYEDFITQVLDEKSKIRSSVSLSNTVKMFTLEDGIKLTPTEKVTNKFSISVEEEKTLGLEDLTTKFIIGLNELESNNVKVTEKEVNNISYLRHIEEEGKANISETFKDIFKYECVDSIGISNQRENTILNSNNSVLNSNLYMNGFYCYDRIIMGNKVEVRF